MDLKALRESCGLKQTDIVRELNEQGIKANKSDISRLENGIIETYLFLGHKVAEILSLKVGQENQENATQRKFKRLQLTFEAQTILNYIQDNGSIDYETAMRIIHEDDRRKVRSFVQELRCKYPIIELQKGLSLATTVAECDRQIGIYEKKKRVYSYQETPLIAKRYELQKGLENG